ncbi:tetratricopeptide repeat protein [Pseudonocardia humida]|uniref:Tetratricopeptide repeat protein n=1 Tax=Pseudonocardia humida TaxID=2800819 RepID=A0ABT1A988_9PSEU|nr:tetratricopeptide repeat protein [Pseudonocardia humida]MCO1659589.1 tetratricopeptide repeat protein [Pseudonocardia humida]
MSEEAGGREHAHLDEVGEAARRAEHLRAVGRLDDAERVARAGLTADPDDPRLLGALSAVLLNAQRHEEGLAAADAAVAALPDGERGHRLRALHLSMLGRHEEAVQAGYRCVTLLPEEPAAATGYARTLQRAGRLGDALRVAQRVVELAPDAADSHLLLADIASDMPDPRSRAVARRAYEQTLRLDPENAAARHDLAVLDAVGHRPARALRGLIEAGRMDPAEPTTIRTVAAVLWQLSWRLRIWLLVATIGQIAAAQTVTGSRIAAAVVLAASAGLGLLTLRDLPRQALPVVRGAIRTDRALTATYLALAYCVLVYVLILVSGFGFMAVTVWVVLIGLGWLALIIRIFRRRR